MLAVNGDQLPTVMAAANNLPQDERWVFLESLTVPVQQRGSRFTAADLDDAVRLACCTTPPPDAASPLPAAVDCRGTIRVHRA